MSPVLCRAINKAAVHTVDNVINTLPPFITSQVLFNLVMLSRGSREALGHKQRCAASLVLPPDANEPYAQ